MKAARFTISVLIFFILIPLGGVYAEFISGGLAYENQWPYSVFSVNKLFGRVRQVTETAYTINHENGKTSRDFRYVLLLSYNTDGLLLSEEYFDEVGNPANRIDYYYNDGHLELKTQSHPKIINPDREIFNVSEDGKIIEAEKIFSNGNYGWKYKNSYDNFGRIVLTSKYDRYWKWKLVYSKLFEYNDSGRLASAEGFGMDTKLLWRDEFSYDSEGRLIESTKYNPDAEMVVRVLNSYNEHDLVVRREFFDYTEQSYAVYSYGYKLDDFGNWTAKVIGQEAEGRFNDYLVPTSMVERNIEYFD